jgi:murein endopeptidase
MWSKPYCARSMVATMLMLHASHTVGIDADVDLHNLVLEMPMKDSRNGSEIYHIKVHEPRLNGTLAVNIRLSASQHVVN